MGESMFLEGVFYWLRKPEMWLIAPLFGLAIFTWAVIWQFVIYRHTGNTFLQRILRKGSDKQ